MACDWTDEEINIAKQLGWTWNDLSAWSPDGESRYARNHPSWGPWGFLSEVDFTGYWKDRALKAETTIKEAEIERSIPDRNAITIVKTQHIGAYRGRRWAAFNLNPWQIPIYAYASNYDPATNPGVLCGYGDTPDEALAGLKSGSIPPGDDHTRGGEGMSP